MPGLAYTSSKGISTDFPMPKGASNVLYTTFYQRLSQHVGIKGISKSDLELSVELIHHRGNIISPVSR